MLGNKGHPFNKYLLTTQSLPSLLLDSVDTTVKRSVPAFKDLETIHTYM